VVFLLDFSLFFFSGFFGGDFLSRGAYLSEGVVYYTTRTMTTRRIITTNNVDEIKVDHVNEGK
jgi:hypothetical protein